MRTKRVLAVASCAAWTACATVVEGPPPGPSPFRAVKKVALVRRVDDPRAPRGRDAIDALKESLDARGYETRVIELGAGKDGALRDLDRLEERIGGRLWVRDAAGGSADALGAEAGAIVARLGVDAVAGYHRLDPGLAPLPPPPEPWGAPPASQARAEPARRPAGALSLVAADGSLAWFPWGGAAAELDPAALINPAEAIDALLAALAGGGEGE
ncbi:MAG TPA: hypothetical protein VFL83_20590 [Anaeromyxobacter sp.]|nr:hypothetical protein [Anaeromyxobacter sp.]